ncbi:MAG: nucleotidyltransferase family protein [Terriglobia bacterium]
MKLAILEGVFDKYPSRLQARERQRDAAIAELRAARFFSLNSYRAIPGTWQPNGGQASGGEFVIEGPGGDRVLVEVKHPDWESELTREEQRGSRKQKGKFGPDLEVRRVAPWKAIQHRLEKADSKFDGSSPGLLVVSNNLFVDLGKAPHLHASQALYGTERFPSFRLPGLSSKQPPAVKSVKCETGLFTDSRFEKIGGVGILIVESDGPAPVRYDLAVYVNGFALPSARLPQDFLKAFRGVRQWSDPTVTDINQSWKWIGQSTRLDREKILHILDATRDAGVLGSFGVRSIGLFGSAARGANDAASDLDFVVELRPKTFANYMGLKEYLENLFGCRVDLVTEEAIKPALRENILSECVHAAGL